MITKLLHRFIREAFAGLRQADHTRLLVGASLAALIWFVRPRPTNRELLFRTELKPGQSIRLHRRSSSTRKNPISPPLV